MSLWSRAAVMYYKQQWSNKHCVHCVVLSLSHANSFRTAAQVITINLISLFLWNLLSVDNRDSKEVAESPHRQKILQPSTDLSVVRRYETGDLGLTPRANVHLCTRVDTMRWVSASVNYQMVGRILTRTVATQTPESWSQSRRHHHWTVFSNSSHDVFGDNTFSFLAVVLRRF